MQLFILYFNATEDKRSVDKTGGYPWLRMIYEPFLFVTFSYLKDLTRNMNRGLPHIFHPALPRTRQSLDEGLRIHVLRHTSSPRFPPKHAISIDLQASRDYQQMIRCYVLHVCISVDTRIQDDVKDLFTPKPYQMIWNGSSALHVLGFATFLASLTTISGVLRVSQQQRLWRVDAYMILMMFTWVSL